MSPLLHFVEHPLQEFALVFMGVVYVTRLLWFFRRFKKTSELQPPTGSRNTGRALGVVYSLGIIALPWHMESYRKKPWMYAQFAFFHLGVAGCITLSFLIPYAPETLTNASVVRLIQALCAIAGIIGVYRFLRRVIDKTMRAISAPDDYFSVVLLSAWLFLGAIVAPNTKDLHDILVAYFIVTAFFLVYVPFSKISHYLYYPIARFYLGRTMGHRGVFPIPSHWPTVGEANR